MVSKNGNGDGRCNEQRIKRFFDYLGKILGNVGKIDFIFF